jgi:Protein of unknown function (DUF1552)
MNRLLSRRTILRGAGVALTLPWLESLAPRTARAAVDVRQRFLPIFLPNGASEIWAPATPGVGAAWQLSSVLAPLESLKAKLSVLSHMENGTSFNADRASKVEPSHGRQPAGWLTCTDPAVVGAALGLDEANSTSVDQLVAKFLAGKTPLESLQVGLSTTSSNCDGNPCSNSRTVSWSAKNKPMYKSVDPLEVFNKLVGVTMPTVPDTGMVDAEAMKRIALNQSVLDSVIANTNATKSRLGKQDQQRLDDFLDSVRAVEKKATSASSGMGGLGCTPIAKPVLGDPNKPVSNDNYAKQNSATYNKGTHADIMNDLIVMAFQCDATRVISYMLEDERSEFTYDHVRRRTFTQDTSTETAGNCPEYHGGGQHGTQDDFATITWWNVGKVAALCGKLDQIVEENGKTVLDNTLVMFGGAMHGSDHACKELPLVLIGSGGGVFKTDQHVALGNRWLRDLHHTVMKDMYGMSGAAVDGFGAVRADVPRGSISEILLT